jgi:Cu+-exporting ATPase
VTEGRMAVVGVVAGAGETEAGVLRRAASVETGSEHPVARAVVAAARSRDLAVEPPAGFRSTGGLGVEGIVDGIVVRVGRSDWLVAGGLDVPPELDAGLEPAERNGGGTTVLVGWDGRARGALALDDLIKPTSAAAVTELRGLGLRPVLLTGDNAQAAGAVAAAVGIGAEDVIAGVLPEGKVDAVLQLQHQGRRVAMVGDGVNDAAALAAADLGIALGTGTDVAIEAGDVTLLRGEIGAVPQAVRLSRATLRTIRQNLGWAFGYNLAALPLAGFGLLNPLIAGLAMALSSVAVVSNSLRLRGFDR